MSKSSLSHPFDDGVIAYSANITLIIAVVALNICRVFVCKKVIDLSNAFVFD